MKRLVLLIALLILGLASGSMLMSSRRAARWTTEVSAASAAFGRCLDAEMKLYHQEALGHCQRALELDPNFAIARLKVVLWTRDEARRERLFAELRGADLDPLNDRERFLLRHSLARFDHDEPRARRFLEEYLAAHPRDPFALDLACMNAWEDQAWEEADACYKKLLAADPNWVRAQNHRGYLAMGQGQFAEAEERFRAYLYLAPDQANPHDSLAELLTLRGRYEEAGRELAEALRIRPDFCASRVHLVTLRLLQEDARGAAEAARGFEAQESCAPDKTWGAKLRCAVAVWEPALAADWEGAWAAAGPCLDAASPDAAIVGQRAALRTGRAAEARQIEERLAARGQELAADRRSAAAAEASALASHLRGVRSLVEGKAASAVEDLAAADRALRFWDGLGAGVFKLYNLSRLAEALQAAGREADAAAAWRRLDEVNPAFAARLRRDPAP